MSTETERLKAELETLSWNELRTKYTKEYGMKMLPEYKAPDLIKFILDRHAGVTKYITDTAPLETKNDRAGWSRIKVLKNTQEQGTHCMAAHNGYQFAIAYNKEVNLPTVTARYLETKHSPVMKDTEGDLTVQKVPRWVVHYIECNDGPNGEPDYIPESERGKYWNAAREAKLARKRFFFAQLGFWPTDKVIREYTNSGLFRTMVSNPQ